MTANIFRNYPVNGLGDGRITRVFAKNLTGAAHDGQIAGCWWRWSQKNAREGRNGEKEKSNVVGNWRKEDNFPQSNFESLNANAEHFLLHSQLSRMSLISSFILILIVKKYQIVRRNWDDSMFSHWSYYVWEEHNNNYSVPNPLFLDEQTYFSVRNASKCVLFRLIILMIVLALNSHINILHK